MNIEYDEIRIGKSYSAHTGDNTKRVVIEKGIAGNDLDILVQQPNKPSTDLVPNTVKISYRGTDLTNSVIERVYGMPAGEPVNSEFTNDVLNNEELSKIIMQEALGSGTIPLHFPMEILPYYDDDVTKHFTLILYRTDEGRPVCVRSSYDYVWGEFPSKSKEPTNKKFEVIDFKTAQAFMEQFGLSINFEQQDLKNMVTHREFHGITGIPGIIHKAINKTNAPEYRGR